MCVSSPRYGRVIIIPVPSSWFRIQSLFFTLRGDSGRLFGDLARVFLEVAIVLGQPFLGVKDSYSDFVKVRIGRMHQYVQVT
jgi:hypothetical protein